MNEVPTLVEHLKNLAQGYHDTHLALQAQYSKMESPEAFLVELKHREAVLLLSLIHISEPTRLVHSSRMPSSA